MKDADEATNSLSDISVVPEPSAEVLNERQQVDYRSQREQCLEWLLVFGKGPEQADGYAHTTVKCRGPRMDQFYRWVQSEENGYTTDRRGGPRRSTNTTAAQESRNHHEIRSGPLEDRQNALDRRG